jgi:plastocyanin
MSSLSRYTVSVVAALALIGALVTPSARAQTVQVQIQNFAYSPDPLTISVGTTVTWTNMDQAPHSATSVTNVWSSPVLNTGQSYSFTFTQPGTYPYYCVIHGNMHGMIVVQGAAATATTAPVATATPAPAAPTSTPLPAPTATPLPTATTAPPAQPLALSLAVKGALHPRKSGTVQVTVREASGGKTVAGAQVALDGRKVGLKAVVRHRTNGKGVARFAGLRPARTGTVKITASRAGYRSRSVTMRVKP